MKIRAAVLEEFGARSPSARSTSPSPARARCSCALAACGVCHTDMYTASGVDPSGYAPTVLGHEGAGVVERVGPDVSLLGEGDHVVTLFSPQCGECIHCVSPLTNLCLAIREQQNKGFLPDGTTRLSIDGEPLRHFMGHLDVRGVHGDAGDRAGEDRPRGAAGPRVPVRVRALDGARRGDAHGRRAGPGSTCVVFGAGMVGLGAVAGCRLQGAERIVCVDLSPERLELARGQGATDLMEGGADGVILRRSWR